MRLEQAAGRCLEEGIKATVYNCPEIQTNSSALFLGVEISSIHSGGSGEGRGRTCLPGDRCRMPGAPQGGGYPRRAPGRCKRIPRFTPHRAFRDFDGWPQHNTPEQAEYMLNCATVSSA